MMITAQRKQGRQWSFHGHTDRRNRGEKSVSGFANQSMRLIKGIHSLWLLKRHGGRWDDDDDDGPETWESDGKTIDYGVMGLIVGHINKIVCGLCSLISLIITPDKRDFSHHSI